MSQPPNPGPPDGGPVFSESSTIASTLTSASTSTSATSTTSDTSSITTFVTTTTEAAATSASSSSEKNVGGGGGLKTGHIIAISIAGFVVLVGLAAVMACIVIRRKRGRRPHRVYIDHHDGDEKGSRVALHPFGDRMVGGGEQKYYNQDHDRRSFFEHKVTVIPFLTESTQKDSERGDRDKRSFGTNSTLPDSPVEADLSLLPLPLPSPYEQDDIVSTLPETPVQEREHPLLPPLNTFLRAGNWHSSLAKPGLPYDSTPTASPSISNVALDHHHHEDIDGEGEEEEEAGRDSPSMYSQSSASVLFNMISSSLHRGPSMISYASGTFDLQPTIHESLFDATGSTDSPQPQTSQWRESTGGLERQSTTVIAGLLKSRQRQRQQLPKDVDADTIDSDELFSHPSASAVSHIERAGSIIRPIQVTGAGVTHAAAENASTTREPYGRRFKRMAAEREAAASLAPTHPVL